jgi:hypothetical protein
MWAVGMGVPSALPFLPNPTVALYLFGICFGDWVGLDYGPKDVCRASPYPLYTPPLYPQSALCPPAWGPEQPLTPGQKSLWLSPYHPKHTDRDSNTPTPVLNKCLHHDVFAGFLWGGAMRGWGVASNCGLKAGQSGRHGTQLPQYGLVF